MTPAEIIYRRRLAVLQHAEQSQNVAETCRTFGISRTRYYEWRRRADRDGIDTLHAKGAPPSPTPHTHLPTPHPPPHTDPLANFTRQPHTVGMRGRGPSLARELPRSTRPPLGCARRSSLL